MATEPVHVYGKSFHINMFNSNGNATVTLTSVISGFFEADDDVSAVELFFCKVQKGNKTETREKQGINNNKITISLLY